MNVRTALITTIAIAAAATVSIEPASAQEGGRGGARFNYAPNVYRLEQPRMPKGYGAAPAHNPHAVKAGRTPKGSNFLGLEPTMLATRPAPRVAPAAQHVQGNPSFTSVASHVQPKPFQPAGFSAQFGNPLQAPPLVAKAPPAAIPQAAAAQPLPQTSANKAVAGRVNPRRSTASVSARLNKPRTASGLAAKQGPAIQSYGKNFGYQPGTYVPTGSGLNTERNVHGVIINKGLKRH